MQFNSVQIQWANKFLQNRGISLNADPEVILKTPYSSIAKFSTSQGNFFLKETPPTLFIEVEIIQVLKDKINVIVPSIVSSNKELHCFLMLDAGIPLRDYLKTNFDPNLLAQSIKQYTYMQSIITNNTDDFLKLGVPNWRLKELPALYREIINQEEALRKDGLTESEFKSLSDLNTIFVALCDNLSKFNIPETIDHCDLHDNNILIDPKSNQLTLIDWGEVVITYPLFSLLSFISKAAFQYSLNDEHPIFIKLLDSCFDNWASFATRDDLNKAMLIAKKIWPIYSALGYFRLILSSGMGMNETSLMSYFGTGRNAGRFAKYFKDFIKANLDIDPEDVSHIKLSDPGSRLIR